MEKKIKNFTIEMISYIIVVSMVNLFLNRELYFYEYKVPILAYVFYLYGFSQSIKFVWRKWLYKQKGFFALWYYHKTNYKDTWKEIGWKSRKETINSIYLDNTLNYIQKIFKAQRLCILEENNLLFNLIAILINNTKNHLEISQICTLQLVRNLLLLENIERYAFIVRGKKIYKGLEIQKFNPQKEFIDHIILL